MGFSITILNTIQPKNQATKNQQATRPMLMEMRCCLKTFQFQMYPPNDVLTVAMSTNPHKKSKREKRTPQIMFLARYWARLGWANSSKCFIYCGETPSPGQKSIDKTINGVKRYKRGALVAGSDPPSRCSVHSTASETRRALARLLMQTHLGADV